MLRKNKTFVVFNDPNQPKASEVAAGIINPVVFRRMTKSWLVDEAFQGLQYTYRQMEEFFNTRFFYPIEIHRVLNHEETNRWKIQVIGNQLEKYLEPDLVNHMNDFLVKGFNGIGIVKYSARLDMNKLIKAIAHFLRSRDLIRDQKLNYNQIELNSGSVLYDDITATKIIFCEGFSAQSNPFFEQLKFKNSKGEIIDVLLEEVEIHEVYSRDVFLMPLGEGKFRIGATYAWDDFTPETTSTACEYLLSQLRKFIAPSPIFLNQKAGIRPSMHDRKPIIGFCPNHPEIGIFNGLGSKGALLGPYFAKQLADFATGQSGYIHPEANIRRYYP